MTTPPPPARAIASIVVGMDFSSCCAVALRQAIRLAQLFGARIHVVHVVDTNVVIEVGTSLSPMQEQIQDGLVRDAERAWQEFRKTVPGAAELPVAVPINNRIVGILRRVREVKADLMVLGTFGDRRPEVGMGTVATGCVRASMTDTLLVRDTQPGPFRTVVAAVDFSETSARALDRAALFAARDAAELHVLHVFQQEQSRADVERRLTEFARPVAALHPGLKLRTACQGKHGHRSGIVAYAGTVGADLIALGTRGQTNLRDILLGSTAEKVLAESRCSVLAVKPAGFRPLDA
jgi:universal stress protein E